MKIKIISVIAFGTMSNSRLTSTKNIVANGEKIIKLTCRSMGDGQHTGQLRRINCEMWRQRTVELLVSNIMMFWFRWFVRFVSNFGKSSRRLRILCGTQHSRKPIQCRQHLPACQSAIINKKIKFYKSQINVNLKLLHNIMPTNLPQQQNAIVYKLLVVQYRRRLL